MITGVTTGVTRMNGVMIEITEMTRVTGITLTTGIPKMTGITRMTGMTGMTRVTGGTPRNSWWGHWDNGSDKGDLDD